LRGPAVRLRPVLLVLVALLVVLQLPGRCQDYLEEMLRDVEDEEDYDRFLNLLDTALRQPVNLLTADRSEIAALPWMSPWLADSIVVLREQGALTSVDDLTRIEGVDTRLVELLRPLVIVEPAKKHLPPLKGNLRLRVVASPPAGDADLLKTYALCGLESGSIRVGYLAEKDKNESRLNDFQAYYLEKSWAHARAIVGDFTVAAGHGLVLSGPYGQSPTTVDPWRFSRGIFGIRPMTSIEENFMLEGAGVELGAGTVDVCAAASRAKFDGSVDESGTVTSLNTSGAHVGRSAVEGKDALEERLLAAAARLRSGGAELTLSLLGESLSRDLATGRIARRRDQTRLTGGLDLSVRSGESIFFAEGALAQGGSGAVIGGLAFERPQVEVMVLGRAYGEQYLSLHSRPFSFYSGLATGERGLFTGLSIKASRRAQLSVGNDLHARAGATRGTSGRSGSETYADLSLGAGQFTFIVGEKLVRGEEPPPDVAYSLAPAGPGGPPQGTEETQRLRSRLDIEYRPMTRVRFRARYEILAASEAQGRVESRSNADLMRFDLSLDRLWRVNLDAGFYTFEVEDYSARIYQYEAGVPYYPSLELLKSDGSRWYGVLSLDLGSFGRVAAKYGVTLYDDAEEDSRLVATYIMRF
jgi:hypothetical protein